MSQISSLIRVLTNILVPVALLSTTYLYLYPIFQGCVFPTTDGSLVSGYQTTLVRHGFSLQNSYQRAKSKTPLAPFRLLVLADPQLEGLSSIPGEEADDTTTGKGLLGPLKAFRKKLDLWGNDYYLAHVFRTMHWWTRPSHVTVLGDLIGSQWIPDDEFAWRGGRFWNRTFAGGVRVDDTITSPTEDKAEKLFRMDDYDWEKRVINIAGNHDIGYAGDISRAKIDRFEKMYGKANWDARFEMSPSQLLAYNYQGEKPPSIHLVVVNSMLLDAPAWDYDLQVETYKLLGDMISRGRAVEDKSSLTLLLTHVPLQKPDGVCVDKWFFDYWGEDDGSGQYSANGLREQNHLSGYATTTALLEGLFGMSGDPTVAGEGRGRSGIVLTGHDHEGCDAWHFIPSDSLKQNNADKHTQPASITATDGQETPNEDEPEFKTTWRQVKWQDASNHQAHTGIREVTLRSMMGEFGGNAGLLSAWYDFNTGEWRHEIQMCKLGVQHYWWGVHVLDLITIGLFIASLVLPKSGPTSQKIPQTKAVVPATPKAKQSPKKIHNKNDRDSPAPTSNPKTMNGHTPNGKLNGTPKSGKKSKKPKHD